MGERAELSAALCAGLAVVFGALLAPLLARIALAAPNRAVPLRAGFGAARPSRALIAATGLVCGAGAGLGAWSVGWALELPAFLLLGLVGGVLAIVDARTRRLPNRLVFPLGGALCAGLLAAALGSAQLGDWLRALACGAAVFAAGCAASLISPAGLGFGDVKLAAVLAVALGWRGGGVVLPGLLGGFVLGACAALVLLGARRVRLRSELPMGPPLIAGALLACGFWPA
jgi:leader peptidase (prepilin peptidase)/N-methyltransferase